MSAFGGPNIITDGLVLSLDAGNIKSYPGTGTTWYDKSGNGNDGTLTNGPTFDSGNGGSIVFDGTDDYVLINDGFTNLFKNKSYWSTSIWVKVISWGAGNDSYPVLVSIGAGQGAYSELYLEIGNDNGTTKFYFVYAGDSANGNVEINLNEIYNFVYIKDGDTFKFYKNGTLINSFSGKNNVSNVDGDIWLGRFKTSDFELNGNIYSTQIYNRALTSEEVLQNYNATKERFGL